MGRSGSLTALISGGVDEPQLEQIRGAAPMAEVIYVEDEASLLSHASRAEVIAIRPAQVTRELLRDAERLRWLHIWSAGADEVLVPIPELAQSQLLLTCSKSNGAIPLAEHAMLLMLMLNKNVLRSVHAQEDRQWDQFQHGELNRMTVGIIGLGFSGADLAVKAQAFHMRVLGIRRSPDVPPGVDELLSREGLDELMKRSDFVVVTAPKTPETIGMIGERELRMMKPTAYFICYSRGGIVDDAALLRALQEGWIAGAGIDAHGVEPLPRDSPFWTAPNTIVTPHNGASTPFTRQRGVDIFVENLRRYVSEQPLTNVVDKVAGY